MNARLGFAIAAHLDPEVLLIDEVLAVGDFSFQQKCYQRLDDFRRRGIPIAFVSHNMQAIATLCDRALLLRSGREPILGEVGKVLAEYVSSKGAAADPRVVVCNAVLLDARRRTEISGPVAPGALLTLEVELSADAPFPRCGVMIEIVRSDGLGMFTGMSTLDGLPDLHLEPGDRLRSCITFSANMLRGTYVVNLQLVDSMRQWPAALVHGLRSFVVTETTRVSGCTEILPVYDLTVSRDSERINRVAVSNRP
jgi:energy-coupling factor transporter ATP-binding protein EcfA2